MSTNAGTDCTVNIGSGGAKFNHYYVGGDVEMRRNVCRLRFHYDESTTGNITNGGVERITHPWSNRYGYTSAGLWPNAIMWQYAGATTVGMNTDVMVIHKGLYWQRKFQMSLANDGATLGLFPLSATGNVQSSIKFEFNNDGTLDINGSFAASDSRIKESQSILTPHEAHAMFEQIEVVQYLRTDIQQQRLGFIAQDVKKAVANVLPDVVSNFVKVRHQYKVTEQTLPEATDPDATETVEPEPEPPEPEIEMADFHRLDYSRMVTILWGTVKHLEARIQTLETQLSNTST
jgi:hypothetical protein